MAMDLESEEERQWAAQFAANGEAGRHTPEDDDSDEEELTIHSRIEVVKSLTVGGRELFKLGEYGMVTQIAHEKISISWDRIEQATSATLTQVSECCAIVGQAAGGHDQRRPSKKAIDDGSRRPSKLATVDENGTKRGSLIERRKSIKGLRAMSKTKTLSQEHVAAELKREKSALAANAYVQALRGLVENDGDFTKVDSLRDQSVQIAQAGLKGAHTVRMQVDINGFSEEELKRMRAAFYRFKSPEDQTIHVDDMPAVVQFLGYMKADKDACKALCEEITSYNMLDFQEYIDFIEKFAIYERDEFKKEFDVCDKDNSGQLNFDEVKAMIQTFGITPLRATLREAMDVVDFDGSGCVDFEEFVHLMSVYRVTEGFTRSEVRELRAIFDRVAISSPGEQKFVVGARLGDVMQRWFGPQSAALAQKLARRFAKGETDQPCISPVRTAALGGGSPKSAGVEPEPETHEHFTTFIFSEFLLWARRLREAEINEIRKQFQAADVSGGGTLTSDEFAEVMKSSGYMPLRVVIAEVMAEVDEDGDGELDLEEFVHLMALFRKTDGFSKREIAELTSVFRNFEKIGNDGDGVVDCLELMDILRSMGYVTNLDCVRRYIKEVDFDNSNTLDLPEFLRLMRMHREAELHKAVQIFDKHKEAKTGAGATVPESKLLKALNDVGYGPTDETLVAAKAHLAEAVGENKEAFDFDDFVHIMDECRRALIVIRRMHAGYAEQEVKKFREAFEVYDQDSSGDIDRHELTDFLRDIGIPMRTKEDQKEMLVKLEIAQGHARAAGVEAEAVGPNSGIPTVSFPAMLFLLRMLHSAKDEKEVERDNDIKEKTNFSSKEIADFREVFSFWAIKAAELDGGSGTASKSPLKEGGPTELGNEHEEEVARDQFLALSGMYRVVRSLGMILNPQEQSDMANKLEAISRVDSSGLTPGKYGFFQFLICMRWMMDINFARINELVQPAPVINDGLRD
jgi:Ca2+-binding EF-hand superfamily protein